MSKIIYQDKTFLQELAEIPEINKVTDNNMNSIKKAVNENGQYVSATESNGEFTCTIEGSISQNDIVHILFDTNSTAEPASLSVDGGNTFLNILDASGNSIDASELSGQSVSLKNAGSHFEIETLNSYSNSKIKGYSADYVNNILSNIANKFKFTKTYTYNGTNMSTTNGSVRDYSSIVIHANDDESVIYIEGTLYNNHSTAGGATVTLTSPLRPTNKVSIMNILTFYSNQQVGENMDILTNGTVSMGVYGTANGNSRHAIVPLLIFLD